jgi:3-hydroxyisobutyrate dehydrogenase-like beta-hydroxyacid dehydrogenase
MGATVGAAARHGVSKVLWASEGRSDATRARASEAKLEDCGDLASLAHQSEVLIGVCPPTAATDLANRVAATDFAGIYVDANAVAPATARRIGSLFDDRDADFVDGGIIGPPARRPGTTRLHLSGERARDVAVCFREGPLEARVVAGGIGAASALKMTFAAWTKGSIALLAAIDSVARAEGVEQALLHEWEQSVPDLPDRLRAVSFTARKAWRFEGEMLEIAKAFEAVGAPGGFHRAAQEVYERMGSFKDVPEPPALEEIARRILAHQD